MDSLATSSSEMALEEALRKLDNTVKDESSRRLKLRILLLQGENDGLRSQLEDATNANQDKEDAIRQAEQGQIDLGRAKRESAKTIKVLQMQLDAEKEAVKRAAHKSNRGVEIEAKLQQELEDLQTQIAEEKHEWSTAYKEMENCLTAASGREADLESQLEQLRTKLQSAKDELNEFRTEVVEEKRAVENAHKDVERSLKTSEAREPGSGDNMDQLRTELNSVKGHLKECQKELEKEKRETDKIRKDADKDLKASKAQTAELKGKGDLLRSKLKSTMEQLKECQNELAQARTAAIKVDMIKPVKNSRKRPAHEMRIDHTIGTPDGVAGRGKRPSVSWGRMEQTVLGEKSMFSITPYLNRTINMVANTPVSEDENEIADEVTTKPSSEVIQLKKSNLTPGTSSPVVPQQAKTDEAAQKPSAIKEILGEAKATVKNRKPAHRPSQRKPRVVSTLGNVEEEADENESPRDGNSAYKEKPLAAGKKLFTASAYTEGDDTEQKRKKRKLLGSGKTLFDEDDGEGARKVTKVALGPSRSLGKGGLTNLKGALKPGLSAASAFGGFSPLKKDRRGVNASFLG